MTNSHKTALTFDESINCKIFAPCFNIVSAISAEILDYGAKNERIFKVCN